MFVSNLTKQVTAHAANSVLFALACVRALYKKKNSKRGAAFAFDIRCGIATGPLIAGIVPGLVRFIARD